MNAQKCMEHRADCQHCPTLSLGERYQKRLDRAHKHNPSAIRTLAHVRKLGPAVQINIAEKQINTAG